jgi:hypothetical protein
MTDDTEPHADDVIQDDSDEEFPPLPKNEPVPEPVDPDEEAA